MKFRLNILQSAALTVALLTGLPALAQDASQTGAARAAALAVHADVLAPKTLETAEKTRAKAEKSMARDRAVEAIEQYTQATMQYQAARERAVATAAFLDETLNQRNAAIEAEAQRWAPDLYEEAYEQFEDAVANLEREREDKARADAATSKQLFDMAELQAIQNRILAKARAEIEAADDAGADKYAPLTLERANAIVLATEAALSEDRYGYEYAEELARQAEQMARHSVQVTNIVRSKPGTEELLLTWEAYVARIQAAAGLAAPADLPAAEQIDQLEEHVTNLVNENRQMQREVEDYQSFAAALEEEIRELDAQLGGASRERRELVMRLEAQTREREKVQQTEGIFRPNEAEVFKQSDTIIVRLMGLRFDSGSSDLTGNNDDILNKLRRVIALWPDATFVVEGHTDSRGSERLNQRLSQNRANSVMNYMIANMRVPANRITAVGYGETRPIASNKNEAGRAKNRRIDLLITPR